VNKLRTLLPLAITAIAIVAIAAPGASAAITNGGAPYAGSFSGNMTGIGLSHSVVHSTQGTVVGEIIDPGSPASGTLDFTFSNCMVPMYGSCSIETDGPYNFEVDYSGSSTHGQFTVTEPVTFYWSFPAAGKNCVFTGTLEGEFVEGSPARLNFVWNQLQAGNFPFGWSCGSQASWDAGYTINQPVGGLWINP
jgi:hypothetical protein